MGGKISTLRLRMTRRGHEQRQREELTKQRDLCLGWRGGKGAEHIGGSGEGSLWIELCKGGVCWIWRGREGLGCFRNVWGGQGRQGCEQWGEFGVPQTRSIKIYAIQR